MPKIQLPLNDIGGETVFPEYRPNLIQMWNDEPQLKLHEFSPQQMFNHIWCNLAQYFYIRGEKHKDTMKYLIVATPKFNDGDAMTLYIHPDFYGSAKVIVAAALLEVSTQRNTWEQDISFYTHRNPIAFARIFRVFGAKSCGFSHNEGETVIEKITMKLGLKYESVYKEIISTFRGDMKEKR